MKLIRKVIVSVATLILVAICFGATTYAWFEVNSKADVSGFNFTVMSGQGFLVSVDGVNYSNDLTNEQITQAICVTHSELGLEINPTTRKLVYKSTGADASSEIEKTLSNILLMPRTSNDGVNLKDLYNTPSDPSDGSYLQFSVWFKSASDVVSDNLEYDIFLNGETITQPDGTKVDPTTIKSVASTTVTLTDNMNTIKGSYVEGDQITIASANAMRMSIVEEVIVEEEPEEELNPTEPTVPTTTTTEDTNTVLTSDTSTTEAPKATIYELTNELDLGSYATDYNGEDAELSKLYNADTNAMFTYYNNQRPYNQITKMKFDEKPETVRSLMGEDLPKITTVKSGSDAKLVTFRFWLEGWDADCFDGLAKSIICKLTFTSRKIEED